MTKAEYIQKVKNLIEAEGMPDTSDIDATAEVLTDTIGALYPAETDEERDTLVSAVYEVLRG